MAFDQNGKGELGRFASIRGESLQKLAVAQVTDRAHAVQSANLRVRVCRSLSWPQA